MCNIIVQQESISFAMHNFSLLNISIEQVLFPVHKTKVIHEIVARNVGQILKYPHPPKKC